MAELELEEGGREGVDALVEGGTKREVGERGGEEEECLVEVVAEGEMGD